MLRRDPVGWIGLALFCMDLLWLAAPQSARTPTPTRTHTATPRRLLLPF